jgi:hypothetical protein
MKRIHSIDELLVELTDALHRVASALESTQATTRSLGQSGAPRYTRDAADESTVVGEKKMAELLGISPRTLAEHRRRGRLPGCWVKNGRQVCWMPQKTLEAWKWGIP